ncbi:MAG: amino acid permease [Ignavibacteria bacterium]|nr:amino acid permease [Ignavibacteria bacterium]
MKKFESHSSGLLTRLGLFTSIMIVISSMVGSGVFKKIAPMSAEVGSSGLILLAWLVAGLITLFAAAINAEVASLIAEPGGQYVYFQKMYGNGIAFLYGWSCFAVIQSASIASIAYVFSESVNSIIPLPHFSKEIESINIFGIFYPLQSFGVKGLTIITILFLTTINYFGVVFGGSVTNLFTLLKILGIVLIVFLVFVFSNGSFSNVNLVIENPNHTYSSPLGVFGAFFAAMLSAFWAYDGWNNIGYLGGEVKNAKRNIPISLYLGVIIVILIYLIVNFAFLYVIPVNEMIQVYEKRDSIAAIEVLKKFLDYGGVLVVSIIIMVSTFGTTNGTILASSRLYFAMSRDKLFFKKAGYCHKIFKTPSTSLIIQGFWASILVLSGSFDQLTDMLIFAAFIFYGLGAFGVFVLRKKMKDAHRPYKVFGYPVIPAITVIFFFTIFIITIIQNPRDAGIGLALILIGVPFYIIWNQKKKNS